MMIGMRISMLFSLVFWAGVAAAAVRHVPIQSTVVLRAGEAYTLTIEATAATEIGWRAVQDPRCTTSCVRATDLTSPMHYGIATALGASQKYIPVSGLISIEYKNVSTQPVTIDIYQVERTCEAEACKFLDPLQSARWLVFKVAEFKAISTSNDGSYSIISGTTVAGRPFTFKAVWWTDDKRAAAVNCSAFVKRYLDNRTPTEKYAPYIISGQAIGEADNIVLKSVDTCAPKAPNFGVPEKNVFKF